VAWDEDKEEEGSCKTRIAGSGTSPIDEEPLEFYETLSVFQLAAFG